MQYVHKQIWCGYKDVVEFFDEGLLAWLYEGVLACLYYNSNDGFCVDITHSLDVCFEIFLLAHPLEYILKRTLGGHSIVQHGYMNLIGWSETYVHFSHDHE